MNSREQILSSISKALDASQVSPAVEVKSKHNYDFGIEHFKQSLVQNSCEIVNVSDYSQIVAGVTNYLNDNKLPLRLVAETGKLADLNWSECAIKVTSTWHDDEKVGITSSIGAISETGQIAISNAVDQQHLSLLADHHIVVVNQADLVASLDQLNKLIGNKPDGVVSFIAGPSRTADIEQRLIMGAHGPRSMLVILVG